MDTQAIFTPTRSKYLVLTRDILLPLLIGLSTSGLTYVLFFSSAFTVTTVICSLDFEPCRSPSVLAELEKLKGQNIFLIKQKQVTTRLESGDFTIAQASLTRHLPNKLSVNLESSYPVVALRTKDSEFWAVFDSDLQLIATRSVEPNVPSLIITEPVKLVVGQLPEDTIITQTLQLTRRLGEELFTFKSLELVDKDTLKLTLSDGLTALLTPQKDENEQLSALQAVLTSGTIKDGVGVVDVRFEQPILRP